jgi:DNA polymerase sigma
MNSVIHVDISISYKSSPHEGLKNTLFLKEIFENHPNLMTVCLILKELLRINELNKPFYGGIGSYVLVILVHNILRLKNVDLDDNLMNQLKVVSKYLTTEF